MHTRKLLLSLGLLCSFSSMPVTALGAGAPVEYVRVEDLLTQFHITDPRKELLAITMDDSERNYGFVFLNGKKRYRIYKNGTLVKSGTKVTPYPPIIFWMTEDGHLI